MNVKRILIQLCLLGAVFLPAVGRAQLNFITNSDNTITITGYSWSPPLLTTLLTTLNIPSATNGYPVTSIGDNAFFFSQI